MNVEDKKQMHRERLHYSVRQHDRMIRKAEDFDQQHNISVEQLRERFNRRPEPEVIDLSNDDDDSLDGDDEGIEHEIAEEMQSHILTKTLDQRAGHVFYLLAASMSSGSIRKSIEVTRSVLRKTTTLSQP